MGRISGVVVGIVTNNRDPDALGRVRVRFPWLDGGAESAWARVVSPMAGDRRGLWFLPEVDDEVLVAFQHGRPDAPVVLGALWNGKDKPPVDAGGGNDLRVIKSRSGHLICFDDTEGAEKIEIVDSGAKNRIVIDSAANTVTISANADIAVEAANGKLRLAGASVEITATRGEVALASRTATRVEAAGALTLKGQIVDIN